MGGGGWEYGISRGVQEIKWILQGLIQNNGISRSDLRKNSVEFPGVLVLGLKTCEGVTQFCKVSKGKALFCLEFSGVK